ncbi:hypothetical protein AB0C13_39085 [Streptomyces sp. NPDC049099]|uniref:hypothetical protein n=1 Tax=Streptomyces sp. NPDC049099 TaxID=3155768 RepID=UPI003437D17B
MLRLLEAHTHVRPELEGRPLATFVAESEEAAEAAVLRILKHFGEDTTRTTVRVLLPENSVRYMERQDTYALLQSKDRAYGDSSYASWLGSTQYGAMEESEFRCPEPGCPRSPLFLLTFVEPPSCTVHHTPLELVR